MKKYVYISYGKQQMDSTLLSTFCLHLRKGVNAISFPKLPVTVTPDSHK